MPLGDFFNVKINKGVGDGKSTHSQKICRNKANENGNLPIGYKLHILLITNTIFKHKHCQLALWILPIPLTFQRKNAWQNQIDYVLLRKNKTLKYLTQGSLTATSQDVTMNQL